ncbi:hypothetical protein MJO28_015757 [Puccinia striiformis f. sp. tritici]|uniref:Integrase zinc-binding domain-containing protein n=2 Tax=Puccinia striiformis TaxID=27350 RepID=A0A2S4W4I5_9BASI|nr:hypothetical protein Pst134EA_029270 [Puccinia striiformis f. sp. tritici]KAI9614222.1 hypothetical protein H4Q26_009363 [Puccinia striiformis f. sp. tritici PST-130]POW16626.1 hypothetical protein PSTT_01094 [Puccinia striiformis]KAH9447237.1 hypothetical protein Pst134EA_029270 [Puccinia striiformis f. sp. tritici]KAI7936330.1 hypothetical protein MJO29_015633 [Puccinia striiformis f. sp. tritici]KAI7936858.1 hypothetical protein MJO28_015757 [Puccinia striiformis f. sp. tritici]
MWYPPTSATQMNWISQTPATGHEQSREGSCIDGSDGYPTLANFTSRMEAYLAAKKRPDRTVISSADLHHIHQLLLDPEALRADPDPTHRAWVKKTFFLENTLSGTMVCHREKGQPTGRPIAVKELMYFILKEAHASEGHGGRDKTAKAVKNTHSHIRKGLICIFLETCPTCQTRIEAVKKEKASALNRTLDMASRDSIVSFGTGFLTPATSPTNFAVRRNVDGACSLFQSVPQSADLTTPPHFTISRPTVSPELALVPAAPKPYSRIRNASYPTCSMSRKDPRMLSGPALASIPSTHSHSPHLIMPNTAISSHFSSRDLTVQRESQARSSFAPGTSLAVGMPIGYEQAAHFAGQSSAWSHQPQPAITPLLSHANPEDWQIEFANIWVGNEPTLNTSFPAPLLASQPKFLTSETLKTPFIDQFLLSNSTTNLQFDSLSSVSPMTNFFPA